jgi:outer membrane protein assembly factor BamB
MRWLAELLNAHGKSARRFRTRRNHPFERGVNREIASRPLRLEWLEDRRLLAIDDLLYTLSDPNTNPQSDSEFGHSVASDGNLVVVGTPYADAKGTDGGGSVYIYDATTNNLVQTLNNPTPSTNDLFGCSVAVSGNTVVVGAYRDDTGATDAGSAYIYDATTGNLLWTLNNPTPVTLDDGSFGIAVAVSGNTVVVGAYCNDLGANGAGSAYIYDATTGILLETLHNPTPESFDRFGCSVAVSGNTVVVGASSDNTGATDTGAAYIYDAITGSLLWTLNNPTPVDKDYFGNSVAVSGNTVVVGADHPDSGVRTAGSAYIYDATTGNLLWTLNNPTQPAHINDLFGCSVAVSGNTVVVGATNDDDDTGATYVGSAYIYDATTGILLETLDNPNPSAFDDFGRSVAVSGNTVVVGSRWDDTRATNAGLAYIYDAGTGNLLRTLDNPTPASYDRFGYSVAVSGNTVVVGAYATYDAGAYAAGSAYIYDATAGNLLWTLNNPTPESGDYFGSSVAVSGNTVVVGAYRDDTGTTDDGSAYVYDATTGNLLWTLNNPTPESEDYFGSSVAVSGNTVVVGAYRDDTDATNAGSAYIYDATTGNLLKTLNNPAPAGGDYFGYSVAVSGSTLVVGAYLDDTGATNAGSAYIYNTTGNLLETLNNPTPVSSDYFGHAVAVSDNTVVIGARSDDTGATDAGSAYIYNAGTGTLLWTLNNPTPASSDYFGHAVAVSGNAVVVGAYCDDTGATDAGSAYTYDAATGNLLWTFNNPTPSTNDLFGYSVAVSGNTGVVGEPYEDGASTNRGAAHVCVDINVIGYPMPLEAKQPLGSLIYDPSVSAAIGTAGDTDSFTIDLEDGQTVTVVVDPDATLVPTIELFDPSSSPIGSMNVTPPIGVSGEDAVLQVVETIAAGTYTITIGGANGTTGTYTARVIVNAAVEEENHDGPSNDTSASAQDLNASFITLGGGLAQRGAVLGTLPSDGEQYAVVDSEDFESGALDGQWTTYSSSVSFGRIQVGDAQGAGGGAKALLMDVSMSNFYNLNEAIWTVDLSGLTEAELTFYYMDRDGTSEADTLPLDFTYHSIGDGVAISDDGVNWRTVLNAPDKTDGVWNHYTVDLDAAAAAAEMTLGADFRIKFQQYDNYPFPTDGRGYDEILITTPAVAEDWYSFTLDDGQTTTLGMAAASPSNLTMELYDGSLTLLATGTAAANLDQVINNFADATTNGVPDTYYARTTSDSASDYSLVVTRDAAFDIEANDSFATGQNISGVDVALGSLDAGSGGGLDQADFYAVNLNQGDRLQVTTHTPFDDPSKQPVNGLDPRLVIFDPSESQVASDSNSAPDGHNAQLTFTAATSGEYRIQVLAEAGDGEYLVDVEEVSAATVTARHIFYNNSKWDGHAGFAKGDPAANEFDDGAIASDKEALLPGQTGTFANYTSYGRGINGIMVDIQGLADPSAVADGDLSEFDFRYGNDDTPDDWPPTPTPLEVTARDIGGGVHRITFIWADKAIPNKNWLQVTVKADPATGLAADDVFYFGNTIGENTGDFRVDYSDAFDIIWPLLGTPLPIGPDHVADINRDGRIDYSDVFDDLWPNLSGPAPLKPIHPPALPVAPLQSTDSVFDEDLSWAMEMIWFDKLYGGSGGSDDSEEDDPLEATAVDGVFSVYYGE